ncbi:MAG TPA: tetratricopeptide repeat protein [Polyangiaceae bacterium]|jgi:tetratricopeptide (TPR) repeat protein
MRARSRVLAGLGLVLLWPPPLAAAEPRADRELAHEHFERGVALSRKRSYAEALAEFQAAYDATPHFSVLYNIGQAQIALGRHAEASRTLQRYLDEGGANLEASRRVEVEASVARETEYTGAVEVAVDAAGALVSVDALAFGRSPLPQPIAVDPGPHTVAAMLDSGEHRELTIEVAAHEQRRVELDFADESPPAIVTPSVPTEPAPQPRATQKPTPRPVPAPTATSNGAPDHTLAYVIGGVGVALSGAALAHFIWNRGRYQDWKDAYADYNRDPNESKREQTNRLADSITSASRVTIGLALGAGLALGTGGVLFLVSDGEAPGPARRQALRPWVGWRGRF